MATELRCFLLWASCCFVCIYVCIYIHIEREREYVYSVCIYIYIYICIHTLEDCHNNTRFSPDVHRNSPESHQSFTGVSSDFRQNTELEHLKKGITTTRPSHRSGRIFCCFCLCSMPQATREARRRRVWAVCIAPPRSLRLCEMN